MTDHQCPWSVGVTNQHAWIQSPFSGAWHFRLHWFELSNFFFSLFFLYARVLVNQFLFFSPLLMYAQPGFESSLEKTFSWFFDLFLVSGMTLHIVKITTQTLNARAYDCSTFNPYFNLWHSWMLGHIAILSAETRLMICDCPKTACVCWWPCDSGKNMLWLLYNYLV